MKHLLIGVVILSAASFAQADCRLATRNFEVSRNNMRPDVAMVQRAYDEMAAACGYGPQTFVPAPAPQYQPPPPPARAPQSATVSRCDARGCWDIMGTRYNMNQNGTFFRQDGAFCSAQGRSMVCQ